MTLWTLVIILFLVWFVTSIIGPRRAWYGTSASAPPYLHIIWVLIIVIVAYAILRPGSGPLKLP